MSASCNPTPPLQLTTVITGFVIQVNVHAPPLVTVRGDHSTGKKVFNGQKTTFGSYNRIER